MNMCTGCGKIHVPKPYMRCFDCTFPDKQLRSNHAVGLQKQANDLRMKLRDEFAKEALGWALSATIDEVPGATTLDAAKLAYRVADAMLAARDPSSDKA